MADKVAAGIVFPPYGVLNQDEETNDNRLIPQDWFPLETDKGNTFEEKFNLWFAGVMEQFNDVIWPTWDAVNRQWTPSAALKYAEALTRGDFRVFDLMASKRVNRGLDQLPDSPNRSSDIRRQRDLYVIEDDRVVDGEEKKVDFGSYYRTYDSHLDVNFADSVAPMWFHSVRHKLRHTHYHIKALLQRPRPYQTALLTGYPHFINEVTQTGLTPSACSGHCVQGVLGIGGVYEYLIQSGVELHEKSQESLKQYAVDIGDRRVMAGIHYPSDNLSSWILFMNLADRVYRNPKIKCWIWHAIRHRSFVYQSIVEFVAKNGATPEGKALQRPLQFLQQLAPKDCDCI